MGESTLTVGRIGGGTSVNAIPAEAWLELDLRSEDGRALSELEARVRRVLESGVLEVNRRRTSGAALDLEIEVIGDRPCGVVPPTAPLVAAACAATRFLGEVPELAASSTDANVPIALGIPALTLGAGGTSGGAHTTEEWYENEQGALGVERALLVLLLAAGVA
jgi:acetylornithine deacetylase/succinyl-diaminopimelate desuccinylase-like protein